MKIIVAIRRYWLISIVLIFLIGGVTACDNGDSDVTESTGVGHDTGTEESDTPKEDSAYGPIWKEISATQLADYTFDWSPDPVPGYQSAIMSAWSGGAFDQTRNRLLVTGGGHTDYGGQEIYAFDLDTLSWSQVSAAENYDDLDNATCNYEDRTANNLPKAQHTYGGLAYIEPLDSLCDTRGSVGYQSCGAYAAELACYSFTTQSWSFDTSVTSGGTYRSGAVDGATNDWWILGGSTSAATKIGHYDVSEDSWEYGAYDAAMQWGYKTAVFDSDNGYFIVFYHDALYVLPAAEFVAGVTRLSSYEQPTTGESAILDSAATLGVAYDPVGHQVVAWAGGSDVYFLNTSTWVWTRQSVAGATPPAAPQANGTFGRFAYSEASDVFVLANATTENVYILDLRSPQAAVTTFDLTSAITSDTTPFTVGVGFNKGDISSGNTPSLSLANYQVEVKRYWNDGSVKHAIFSGTYPSTADIPTPVAVYADGESPAGTALTESDMATAVSALGQTTVQLGTIGTSSLASLSGSADRIWLQGTEMIEAHYSEALGSSDLAVKWYIRLYASGAMQIRVIIENGTIDGTNATESYQPTITIDGNVVFSNEGAELAHAPHTRYAVSSWVNTADPKTTIAVDTDYLQTAKLVPNYWKSGPSSSVLDSLEQEYSPLGHGSWTAHMGDTGAQGQIGLLPKWDALYLNSGADARAFRSVIANAEALNSYPLIWSDAATAGPIAVSDWPGWGTGGANGNGSYYIYAGELEWDAAHHGSGGYLAYLLTGDYYYLETLLYQADLCYLTMASVYGSGTSRILKGQTRQIGWAQRTVGQAAAIAPASAVSDDLVTLLANNVSYWNNQRQAEGMNQLGILYSYEVGTSAYDTGESAPWQNHFWVQALGYLSDLEPLPSMTQLNLIRDYSYQSVVGILGAEGTDNYCYADAGVYNAIIADQATHDPTMYFDSWGAVYSRTFGADNTACGDTLTSNYPKVGNIDSPSSWWANLFPALSYAVEDNAEGAAAAFQRFTGAANFSDFEDAGFADYPNWGIVPRGWE